MREIDPEDGEAREHTWYAWWPVQIGRETRWLEYVTARQIYVGRCNWQGDRWVNVAFVD